MNSKNILLMVTLFVACAAQVASDIYTPSIPAIAISLNTSIAYVQFSMAIFMYGLAISQIFYGPLSEGIGRRKPLLIGVGILLIGNLISLFAATIEILIIGRLIQGLGAGACSSLWRSVFRDSFEGVELAKYGSYFSVFIVFIVPAIPTIGGYLQEYFHWRASFLFLAFYSLITILLILFGLKETNKYFHKDRLKLNFIASSFKTMMLSPIFIGYTFCTFLCYGAFFAWFSAGPVLLIHILHVTPVHFGYISLFGGGIATALGGFINGRVVSRFGGPMMLRIGFSLMIIAGFTMLVLEKIYGMNVTIIVAPMVLFYFGVSFIWSNAFAGAFGPFGHIAGYAGALYGCMQISGAALIGTLVSYLPHDTQEPLALIFILTAILSFIIFEKIVRRKEKQLVNNG